MHERCLMLRPRTQTSSPRAGQDVGTPCTTSCRVPPTPRAGRCPSPCLCPSCTSTRGEQMTPTLTKVGARLPPLRETQGRGTAKKPPTFPIYQWDAAGPITATVRMDVFEMTLNGSVAEG